MSRGLWRVHAREIERSRPASGVSTDFPPDCPVCSGDGGYRGIRFTILQPAEPVRRIQHVAYIFPVVLAAVRQCVRGEPATEAGIVNDAYHGFGHRVPFAWRYQQGAF